SGVPPLTRPLAPQRRRCVSRNRTLYMQQIGLCRTSLSRGRAKRNSQVVRRRAAPLTAKAGSSYDPSHTLIYQLQSIWYSGGCDRSASVSRWFRWPNERSFRMSVLDQHLADFDPEVAELIGKELE